MLSDLTGMHWGGLVAAISRLDLLEALPEVPSALSATRVCEVVLSSTNLGFLSMRGSPFPDYPL